MKYFRGISQFVSEGTRLLNGRGVILTIVIVAIVSLFVLPLRPFFLDILLAINLGLALVILVRSLFSEEPATFFAFPAVLLVTTLFRLALNVASIRLVLLHGDQGHDAAGNIIQAFGEFVVQGDFIVGAVVFAVIATVNFLIIAKGSARVAEVSARFALDALPGKQFAIDADLRSGNITIEESAQKRAMLNLESRFYGSMDGAMKFVQGDAVAGLVIVLINSLGGILIGLSRGMKFTEAIDTYSVLSIGDGLVSIIPSLLISLSAGVVVTQVGSKEKSTSATEIFSLIFNEPRALLVAGIGLFICGLIPGFPILPFGIIGLTVSFFALKLPVLAKEKFKEISNKPEINKMRSQLSPLNILRIELDPSSAQYLGGEESVREEFAKYLSELRQTTYLARGINLPEVEVIFNNKLELNEYYVSVREQLVRKGTIAEEQQFVVATPNMLKMVGINTERVGHHPVDRRTGAWIANNPVFIEPLSKLGVKVLNAIQYLVFEAVGACFEVIEEVIGVEEIHQLLSIWEKQHPTLVKEVIGSGIISYPELAEVLRRLLRERVNIRDLKLILEGIAEFHAHHLGSEDRNQWLIELHTFLRLVLSRNIISDALGPGDRLRTFTLSGEIENEFRSASSSWDQFRSQPPLDPEIEIQVRRSAIKMFSPVLERGVVPIVVLCPGDIRPAVQEYFAQQMLSPEYFRTLSYEEVRNFSTHESIGVLSV